MGIFSTIFGSENTIDKGVDALINVGDKLVYTDEEKADMKKQLIPLHIELLKASHPFKRTQRIIAIWFCFLFGVAFIVGLVMAISNVFIKFYFVASEKIKDPTLLDVSQIYTLVGAFSMGGIVLAIVSFYFGGGMLESLKRTFIKK